jgi:hypothetical protein
VCPGTSLSPSQDFSVCLSCGNVVKSVFRQLTADRTMSRTDSFICIVLRVLAHTHTHTHTQPSAEVDGACSTHGREKCTRFWWEIPKERDHLEDQGVGGKMDLREIGLGGVDWILVAQDRNRWRAVVSAVMNLLVLAPRS